MDPAERLRWIKLLAIVAPPLVATATLGLCGGEPISVAIRALCEKYPILGPALAAGLTALFFDWFYR